MSYTRFAVYYLPLNNALSAFGESWFGWDVAKGEDCERFNVAGLVDVTAVPRKYGLHGTLKAPFRLVEEKSQTDLQVAVKEFATNRAPVILDGLGLASLGRFLAIKPIGDESELAQLASSCVIEFDRFRKPATASEIARRQRANLSERQNAMMLQWGYPYAIDEFRFHITLSGKLSGPELERWHSIADEHLPDLPKPFHIDSIALVGEREDGQFELIEQFALAAD